MPEALLVMSTKEIDRLDVVRRVLERRLSQKKAAELMGVTSRQARRMCTAFRRDGAAGLLSKRRGRPSNNVFRLPTAIAADLRNVGDAGTSLATLGRRRGGGGSGRGTWRFGPALT